MVDANLHDLIKDNNLLIYKLIAPYTKYIDKEDLYQVAVVGLLKAYKQYKKDKNTKFSSFAYFYIQGELNEYARKTYYFNVTKEMTKLSRAITKAENFLEQKNSRKPTLDELARFLELDLATVIEVKARLSTLDSLDKDDLEHENLYHKEGYIEQGYNEEVLDLKVALEDLSTLDKRILKDRYEYGYTQKEVSRKLGISQAQVSRKEKDIITRLRSRLD